MFDYKCYEIKKIFLKFLAGYCVFHNQHIKFTNLNKIQTIIKYFDALTFQLKLYSYLFFGNCLAAIS